MPKLPARNEPCNCGSGKKFKKCCLPKMRHKHIFSEQSAKAGAGLQSLFNKVASSANFKKTAEELLESADFDENSFRPDESASLKEKILKMKRKETPKEGLETEEKAED